MGKGLLAGMLGGALVLYWAILSGKLSHGLLLSLGAVSVVLVIVLVERMGILDREASPYHRLPAVLRYWGWLSGEIVKANIQVARAILRAELDLTPRLFRVKATQETDLGRTIFANSITLTPGTVTVDIEGDEFIVHALLDSMADPAGFEEMGRRSKAAAEGGPW